MTVASETNKVSYAGNGTTATFSTVFTFAANDEVVVTLAVDATGVETVWAEGTQYSLAGHGSGIAGTVTVDTSPTNYTPATGETLIVTLAPEFTQPTLLPRGGTVSPKDTLEAMHDKRVRQILRLKEEVDRSLKLAVSSTASTSLPAPVALEFLRWDSAGTALESVAADLLPTSVNADSVLYDPAGVSAVQRTAESVFNERVSVKDFGAAGDGVTDDTAAFVLALAEAAGNTLFVPAGTYRLDITTAGITTPANINIVGEEKSSAILKFYPDSGTYTKCFVVANAGLSLSNLTITNGMTTGSASLLALSANTLSLNNVILNGGVTHTGPTLTHTCYGIAVNATGAQDDLRMVDCDVTQVTYGLLKANSDTSTQDGWNFTRNKFYTNYNADLSLNSPLGSCSNVTIVDNVFSDNQSIDASITTSAIAIALASVTNFVVRGNKIFDDYQEAIHIEEGSYYGVVEGNVVNSSRNGISFNGNNINAGGALHPKNVVVSNNTLIKSGTAKSADHDGIRFVSDANYYEAAEDVTLSNNIIEAYDVGITLWGDATSGHIVRGNNVKACAWGISMSTGTGLIENNYTSGCDVGLYVTDNGVAYEGATLLVDSATVHGHTFFNNTLNIESDDYPVTLNNPKWIFPKQTHAPSNTFVDLMPTTTNTRLYGHITSTVVTEEEATTGMCLDVSEVTYAGSSLTVTEKVTRTAGSWAITPEINTSVFQLKVFNASSTSDYSVQAFLNGSIHST